MKKNILITIFAIIIIVLLVVLVKVEKHDSRVIEVNYTDLASKLNEYKEGLVYIPSNNEDSTLIDYFENKYKLKVLETTMTLDQLKDFAASYGASFDIKKPIFLVFDEGKVLGGFDSNLSETEANEMFRYYFYNEIPTKMINYKVLSTGDEYIKKVNSKEYTVAVFGYDACSFCNLYKPVFNKVAKDYNLNIYYFDTDNYPTEEFNKITELDITIPGSCTKDGKDTTLKNGYPTPMTLITKKGKLVGCIKGYVTEDVLVKKLKEFKVLDGGK